MAGEWVRIASFATLVEAEGARFRFQEEGLASRITDGEFVSVHPLVGPAVGNIGLEVVRAHAERAAEVYGDYEAESPPTGDYPVAGWRRTVLRGLVFFILAGFAAGLIGALDQLLRAIF